MRIQDEFRNWENQQVFTSKKTAFQVSITSSALHPRTEPWGGGNVANGFAGSLLWESNHFPR